MPVGTRLPVVPAWFIPTYVLIDYSNSSGRSSGISDDVQIPELKLQKAWAWNPAAIRHPVSVGWLEVSPPAALTSPSACLR